MEKNADLVINYPTLGSFNPMTDYNRVAYLEGLVKFAKPENVKKIKIFMDNYNKEIYNLRDIISDIDNKLKNPYNVEVA